MALKEYYFVGERDAEFAEASRVLTIVGLYVGAKLRHHEYGKGVAWIVIQFSLVDVDEPTIFKRRHEYEPGRKTVKNGAAEWDVEDALTVSVTLDVSLVRSARSVGDLVELLRQALLLEQEEILALGVPCFDAKRFSADLVAELDAIVGAPSLWWRYASSGRYASGAPACEQLLVEGFPAAVLAFVEQHLPEVKKAKERKDRKAVTPLLNRINEFTLPWGDVTKSPFIEAFPDCVDLLTDLAREISVECNPRLSSSERERIHTEFRQKLGRCRDCAKQVERKSFH